MKLHEQVQCVTVAWTSAIIVKDNEVIGSGHNQVIHTKNVTSHAEINAIIDASKNTNNYRLNNAKMYVTLEPCHMCAKAIIDARIDEVIFAAPEPKTGSIISIDNIYERIKFNHKTISSKSKSATYPSTVTKIICETILSFQGANWHSINIL